MSELSLRNLPREQAIPLAILAVLVAILCGAYWNTLTLVYEQWESPQYSHGWLIPLFTLVLMYLRFEPFEEIADWERWTGAAIVFAGLAMRLVATRYALVIPDMVSFVPCVAGLVMLVGGLHMLRWAGPAIAFLLFMYPLPDRVESMLLQPLQRVATQVSTFLLQTMGIPAFADGNRISLPEVELGVIDACAGLRMLTIFIALSVAITLITDKPWWERIVIILSAFPIALIVNITRITVTGILHMTAGPEIADKVFHDLAGWVMMPLALGLLYIELQLLDHLFLYDDEEDMSLDYGPAATT
ncbi:MAG: exosortase/archaeosortase family protein [Pirellulales bacterium]|nr:exosortase/archaeosortase family protein [Pirellulales bacterium]